MRQFQVYGIGNAIIDIEFKINDDDLYNNNIDKGVVTLVDEDRHYQLLKKLNGINH